MNFRTRCAAIALAVGLLLLGSAVVQAQPPAEPSPLPKVTSGRIERLADFPSKFVDARNVDVWLPEGYGRGKRYNVLYMQDGQSLFDPAVNKSPFGPANAWAVDVTMARLIREGRIPDTIVVGIWNTGKYRASEYVPGKFLPYLTEAMRTLALSIGLEGKSRSDDYLRFLVEELKPAIDRKYRTHPEAAGTFVMGSSMGGLISIYAMCEYPDVFAGAAGMSTHWMGSFTPNSAFPLSAFEYLRDHLAAPQGHRLYMDHGTIQLDAGYAPYQAFIDQIVSDRGYTADNYLSRTFEGKGHNDTDWGARFEIPVLFLMGKKQQESSDPPGKPK